jgi:hypothetical protein
MCGALLAVGSGHLSLDELAFQLQVGGGLTTKERQTKQQFVMEIWQKQNTLKGCSSQAGIYCSLQPHPIATYSHVKLCVTTE